MFENELQPADGKILSQILCRQLSPHVKGLVGPYQALPKLAPPRTKYFASDKTSRNFASTTFPHITSSSISRHGRPRAAMANNARQRISEQRCCGRSMGVRTANGEWQSRMNHEQHVLLGGPTIDQDGRMNEASPVKLTFDRTARTVGRSSTDRSRGILCMYKRNT